MDVILQLQSSVEDPIVHVHAESLHDAVILSVPQCQGCIISTKTWSHRRSSELNSHWTRGLEAPCKEEWHFIFDFFCQKGYRKILQAMKHFQSGNHNQSQLISWRKSFYHLKCDRQRTLTCCSAKIVCIAVITVFFTVILLLYGLFGAVLLWE